MSRRLLEFIRITMVKGYFSNKLKNIVKEYIIFKYLEKMTFLLNNIIIIIENTILTILFLQE